MSGGLQLARAALAGRRAWLVGGALRDRHLGRHTDDFDLVVETDVVGAARLLARAGEGTAFELSGEFGAWRVVARDRSWQVDLNPLRGGSLEADLALRDFTVNALAEPLEGGQLLDPLGGMADLEARRLRMAGARAFADDPLRALRLVRLAVELDMRPGPETAEAARRHAPGVAGVAAERVFVELRRIVASSAAVHGLELMDTLGLTAVLLPELEELKGVAQNRFHHRDVYGHTVEVLEAVIALERDPQAVLGSDHAEEVAALLSEPLADDLTRGVALRLGALFHDIAKPATRELLADGRVSFVGHDSVGAAMTREILTRLRASERLRGHVAALARHHLRAGFLVHHQPLAPQAVFGYLRACEPVEVDVTLLSVADRLATRGDRAQEATARHLDLARALLAEALRWRALGPPKPLVRGDELARELRIRGPRLGGLLEELLEAQYAGEVSTREEALTLARARVAGKGAS